MNCDEVRERTIDYVYGELSEDERASLENHLDQCADCREQLTLIQRPHGLLEKAANHEGAEPTEKVSLASVMHRACRELESSRRRWQRLGATALSLLVLSLGLYAMGLRIEIHRSHVVLSWSAIPRNPTPAAVAGGNSPALESRLLHHQSRLDGLDQLVHALIQTTSEDEQQRGREALLLAKQLQSIRAQNDTRWRTIGYVMGQFRRPVGEQARMSTNGSHGD
jgi:anti-sigma factor RsiW